MMQALMVQSVGQRAHDMLLPDQRSEALRPPLACQNLIAHGAILADRMSAPGREGVAVSGSGKGREVRVASLTPALASSSCGCFLPDLTRLAALQCEETRHTAF